MAKRTVTVTRTRRRNVLLVKRRTRQGATSKQIGAELGIAASTVRDYRTDPYRERARRRQRRYGVSPPIFLNDGLVTSVKGPTGKWHPAGRPETEAGAAKRNRQMRAVIASYAKRGRR
jgi:hypothetical protein